MYKNDLFSVLDSMISQGANNEALHNFMGRGRSRKGVLEGDLVQGELEMGAVSALITKLESASEIITDLVQTYKAAKQSLTKSNFLS
jgi:enoyl-[acyl-carrier protein] reductase II